MIKIIDNKTLSLFLQKYYVNNDDIQLWYTEEILNWILLPDESINLGYYIDDVLVCTISVILSKFYMLNSIKKINEVTFLCCEPSYRKKGISLELINEVKLRCTQIGRPDIFFTGINRHVEYKLLSTTYFYHRPINVELLLDVDFMDLIGTLSDMKKYYEINFYNTDLSKCVCINDNTHLLKLAYKLYRKHIINHNEYKLYQIYSEKTFVRMFSNNKFVYIYAFIKNNKVVDIVSYFILPSYCKSKNKFINGSYLFFYTDTHIHIKIIFKYLFQIFVKNNVDLFTVLNIMGVDSVVSDEKFKFCKGSAQLYYNIWSNKYDDINFNTNEIYKMIT